MQESQKHAAAVALRELGYKVRIEPVGALVAQTLKGYPAATKLRARDLIAAVDGRPRQDPRRPLSDPRRPSARRDRRAPRPASGSGAPVAIRTVPNPMAPSRPFLGVQLQEPKVTLPIPVKFDLGQVGGPSAGLAFALDLLEELGRDVDRGRRIAATGEIGLDGSVRPVGGLKQKTIGARRSGVDLFLVPVQNAAEARQYADGLRIVPVDSFQQALRALATP